MIHSARRSRLWLPLTGALLSACSSGAFGFSADADVPVPMTTAPTLHGGQCVPTSKVGKTTTRRDVQVCEATSFGGRGRVVEATALRLVDVSVTDTGPLPLAGGSLDETLLSVDVPGVVGAGVASADTKSVRSSVQSDASIASVNLLLGGTVVTATVLASAATAACTASGATTSGSSTVAGLRIGGITVTVTGAPNQVVVSGLVRLVLNEQITTGGSIAVRALHASVLAPLQAADVILSEADAQVVCACETESVDAGGDSATLEDASAQPDGGPPGSNDSGPPGSNDGGPPGSSDGGPPGRSDSGPPSSGDGGPPGRSDSGPPGSSDSGSPGRSDSGPPGRSDSAPPARSDSGPPGISDSGPPGISDSGPPGISDSGPPGSNDGGQASDGALLHDAGGGSDGATSSDSGQGVDGGNVGDSGTQPHFPIDGSADTDGSAQETPPGTDAAAPPMGCDDDNPCPSSYTCVTAEPLK